MLSTPSPTPPGKQGGSLLLSDGGTTSGSWPLRSILWRWVIQHYTGGTLCWSWCAVCHIHKLKRFLTSWNCVVEENVWSSLQGWQLHSVTPPLNYCFVLPTYVFSSANRHFFQLNFVVNQIKVKDRSRNRVPVSKVSVLCEKVQEQFSN